ncbi:RICIN domain-containing protein [Streptomyces capoamus]|uniref:RICIN domain-containing protein n=1 Tax=Streptomyces capoamus TaxID=68183 RepID=UPI00167825A2|nr:RICIN domain-containing protein [Streptomyces capoamus]
MRRLLAGFSTAVGLALLGSGGVAHAAPSSSYVSIANSSGSTYCATPQGDSTANGAIITLWHCTGGASQKWHKDSLGRLVNDASGKCLTPKGDAYSTDGTVLTLWTCNSTAASQRWDIEPPPITQYYSGKALTPKGNRMANGVYLTLWTWTQSSVQDWKLTTIPTT